MADVPRRKRSLRIRGQNAAKKRKKQDDGNIDEPNEDINELADVEDDTLRKFHDSLQIPSRGLKLAQHGVDFQLQLLTLLLWRATTNEFTMFRLATEFEECEKFDDVSFQHEKNGKRYFRFLQAKHKEGLDELKNITMADLLTTDTKNEFCLSKYFDSFLRIKSRCKSDSIYSPLTKSEIEDVIICTNVGVSEELSKFLIEGDLTQDILLNSNKCQDCSSFTSPSLYTIDKSPNNLATSLNGIFKETSDCIELVEQISECIVTKQSIKKTGIIKRYYVALTRKVFSVENGGFLPSFIENTQLDVEEQIFRKLLLKEIIFRSKMTDNQWFSSVKINNFKLKLVECFGEIQLPTAEKELKALSNNLANDIIAGTIPENKYNCSIALARELIDVKNQRLQDRATELKKLIRNNLQQKLSKKITFDDLKKIKFKISQNFGFIQLPENSEQLAQKFCEFYVKKKIFTTDSFGEYHVALAKYVIDVNNKTWNESFLNCQFPDNLHFFHRIKKFRRQVIDILIGDCHLNSESFSKIDIFFSDSFFKTVSLSTDFNLINVKTFANQIANQIVKSKLSETKIVTIDDSCVPSDELDLFKENFNKLASHVLVKKYGKVRFSSKFLKLDDHPDQLKKLRSELRIQLKDLFDSLYEYELEIEYKSFHTYDEEELHLNLPVLFSEENISEFFDKLKLIVNYPNRKELMCLIRSEMQNYFKEVDSNNFIALYQKALYDWMTKRIGTFYTAVKMKDLNHKLRNSLKLREMIGVNKGFVSKISVQYKFVDFSDFSKFLRNRNLSVIHFYTDSIPITFIKIIQTFENLIQNFGDDDALIPYIWDGAYVFVGQKQLSDHSFMNDVAESFKDKVNLLMIECTDDDISSLYIQLAASISTENTWKKIVLITSSPHFTGTNLGIYGKSPNHFQIDRWLASKYSSQTIENKFEDLTDYSKRTLPFEKILFQEKLINLKSLFNGQSDDDNIFDSATLEKLLLSTPMEDRLEISTGMKALGEVQKYYISRDFIRNRSYNEDDMVQINQKVFIISSVAGMGKSTVLTKIALKINEMDSATWIFRIDLNNCTKLLAQEIGEKEIHITDAISTAKFLLGFHLKNPTLRTNFERKLFIHNFVNKGNVIFLFDGFDEICPDYEQITLKILKTLALSNIQKVFITTRPNFQKDLEEQLESEAFTLIEFSRENRKRFLINFWSRNSSISDQTEYKLRRLEIYADALIENIHSAIKDRNEEFSGIALQLVMLAEVFENDPFSEGYNNAIKWQGCQSFLTSANDLPNLPSQMNLFNLYEQFVRKKYSIYFLFKKKEDETNIATKNDRTIIENAFFEHHQILALFSFFSRNYQYKFVSLYNITDLDELVGRIGMSKEKIGLINYIEYRSNRRGVQHPQYFLRVTFVHRTFTEYFVANYFATILIQNNHESIYDEIWAFILNELLTETQYEIIRYFINGKLSNSSIIQTTNNFQLFFDKLWKEDKIITVDEDKIFLHILAAEGSKNILYVLWGKFSTDLKRNLIDKGDQWGLRPLHLAARYGHLNLVKWFVEPIENGGGGADIESEDFDGHTPLLAAHEQTDVMKWLIQSKDRGGGGANHDKHFKSGDKLIHFYTTLGNDDIVKWLLEPEYNGGIGIDVNVEDAIGNKLIHYIANSPKFRELLTWIVNSPHVGIIDISAMDSDGDTIFHYAAFKGQFEILQWLLSPVSQGGIGGNINITSTNGSTLLHEAVISGNIDLVKWLLTPHDQVINPMVKDDCGRTVLHDAAKYGHLAIIKELMTSSHVFDIKEEDVDGLSALHEAALFGDYELCSYLINECGRRADIADNLYITVLHLASQYGELKLIQWLINDMGVDADAKNCEERTALHYACRCVNVEVVKWLIKSKENCGAGVNVNSTDIAKRTPLLEAISSSSETHLYKWLFDRNVDIHSSAIRDDFQYYITFSKNIPANVKQLLDRKASESDSISYTENGFVFKVNKIDMIRALIAQGARLDTKDQDGKTILHHIAASDFFFLVTESLISIDTLLKVNDINAEDIHGKTMLHYAVDYDQIKLISWILKDKSKGGGGVDAGIVYKDNKTIIQYALSINDRPMIIESTLQTIAHSISSNRWIWVILVFAVEASKINFAKWLVAGNSIDFSEFDENGKTFMYYICKYDNLKMLKFFVKPKSGNEFQSISGGGLDANSLDRDGKSILHYAVEFNTIDIIKWCLSEYQNLVEKVTQADNFGTSPLLYAIELGKLDFLKVFLKTPTGNFGEYRDGNDKSLIHIAVERSKFHIVQWLGTPKNKGGGGLDVNSDDGKGKTALHYAVEFECFEILQWLILSRSKGGGGADMYAEDSNGSTILHYAAELENLDIMKWLVKRRSESGGGMDITVTDKSNKTPIDYVKESSQLEILTLIAGFQSRYDTCLGTT